MTKKLKVTNIMLANRFGGIGQAYLDYNEALLERGHRVQAICHFDGGWRELTEAQQEQFPRLEMLTVKEKGGPKAIPSAIKIRLLTKRFRPDIIVIHNYLRLGMLATRGIAPQVSVTHMYKCKHFEKLTGAIALTEELSSLCSESGIPEEQIRIVPNMIRPPFYEVRTQADKQALVIGGLGRLDSVKGFSDLIDAVSILVKNDHKVQLKIGGTGFEEDNLKAQVKRLQLEPHVEFLCFVSDKAKFFNQLDLFVIPSTNEPFGIIALEAMKFGIPTIATQVGGLKTIFRHGKSALLVTPGAPTAIAEAVAELIAQPDKAHKLAICASQDVQSKYSLPVVARKLEAALLSWV